MKNNILRILLLASVIAGLVTSCNPEQSKTHADQSEENLLVLKVAGYDLDRLKGIFTGQVQIENCKVEFHKVGIGDANTAAFSGSNT